jgi:glycosyltransferase involved in cell wall biosynthesis
MSQVKYKNKMDLLVDAREFFPESLTGIARVLEGLTDSLVESKSSRRIVLALYNPDAVHSRLKKHANVSFEKVSRTFIRSEKALSHLSRDFGLFISPYPKLPLFGCHCPSVHIIHDVLDLTHPAYRKRFKAWFDGYRLRKALKQADLTWYDSQWSLEETRRFAGFAGRNPRVRHPGIDERFNVSMTGERNEVLNNYGLKAGYVLVIGNGMPHKNLGVLLEASDRLNRKIVFAGVTEERQLYWRTKFPNTDAIWIKFIPDEDLPAIIKCAFCLAQPSTAEGYGYPPLEAMACGIPAVVSNIPVLVETTGNNALVADPDMPDTWLAVFNALENNEYRKEHVENGLRWVEPLRGRRGWQKHVSDIEELIKGD